MSDVTDMHASFSLASVEFGLSLISLLSISQDSLSVCASVFVGVFGWR
jgi:hypothetical protein